MNARTSRKWRRRRVGGRAGNLFLTLQVIHVFRIDDVTSDRYREQLSASFVPRRLAGTRSSHDALSLSLGLARKDAPAKNSYLRARARSNPYPAPSDFPAISLPRPFCSRSACKSTPRRSAVLKGISPSSATPVTVALRSVLLAKLPERAIDTYYRPLSVLSKQSNRRHDGTERSINKFDDYVDSASRFATTLQGG